MNPIIASTFIALSLLIAICVTYTTIALARRVKARNIAPSSALGWLFVGGISVICGNWALHAIDALGQHKAVPLAIDVRMGVFVVLLLGFVGWATVTAERIISVDLASIGSMFRTPSKKSYSAMPLELVLPVARSVPARQNAAAAAAAETVAEPKRISRPVAVPSTPAAAVASTSAPAARRSGRHRVPRRILYIEDTGSGANSSAMREIFAQRPEVELIIARPGAMALDSARLIRPSIILLDLHRPEASGDLLLKQLSRSPECGDVPIVVLTRSATPEQIDRILFSGAYAHVSRPLDVQHFMEILDRVFAVRQVA